MRKFRYRFIRIQSELQHNTTSQHQRVSFPRKICLGTDRFSRMAARNRSVPKYLIVSHTRSPTALFRPLRTKPTFVKQSIMLTSCLDCRESVQDRSTLDQRTPPRALQHTASNTITHATFEIKHTIRQVSWLIDLRERITQ